MITILNKDEVMKYAWALQPFIQEKNETKSEDEAPTLYSDVLDYIEENYPELHNEAKDDEFVACHAIGYFVVYNRSKKI